MKSDSEKFVLINKEKRNYQEEVVERQTLLFIQFARDLTEEEEARILDIENYWKKEKYYYKEEDFK